MFCPNCLNRDLTERRVAAVSVKVDYCQVCKGVWFDKDEVEKAVPYAIKDLSVPSDATPGRRICPHCFDRMYTFDYPQTLVTVDMCRNCKGVWLDSGEAREIKAVRASEELNREEYDAPAGLRGAMLRFVDQALEWVKTF